jgi:polyhydroxyalkanoate synthesis regulator phasin
MLQRLFPTKQKEEDRHKQAVAKIIFLTVVALSVLLAYFLINSRKENINEPTSEVKTLGEQTIERAEEQDEELAKNIAERMDTVKDTAEYVREEIETTTEDVVAIGKKQVETTANELLYSTTLKPIVAKIEDLPEAQQEQLRKQICPQPQE